jgi:hypothetical protein
LLAQLPTHEPVPETTSALDPGHPEGLRLVAVESAFMARLGPLLPTPRAAKKLVNLYRLVRIGIRDQDLAAFIDDETYQVVQILLAILVGSPTTSRTVFTATLHATSGDLIDLLRENRAASVADTDWAAAATTRHRVADTICKIRAEGPTQVNTALAAYRQWCPKLARYSFHTRALVIVTASPDAYSLDGQPERRRPSHRSSSEHGSPRKSLRADQPPTTG